MKKKPLVIIESPYRSGHPIVRALNTAYLEKCIRDSVQRGETPYASHKMLTTALDDEDQEERELGIECGLALHERADLVAFYVDRGWSPGMMAARARCEQHGTPHETRSAKEYCDEYGTLIEFFASELFLASQAISQESVSKMDVVKKSNIISKLLSVACSIDLGAVLNRANIIKGSLQR